MKIPAGPKPITVRIEGRLRAEVSNALIDAAIGIEREYTGRRAKTQMGRFALEQATRLRALSLEIMRP